MLLKCAEAEKLLLMSLHARIDLVDVAEEDKIGGFDNANHTMSTQWNEVCDFELLRQMLDLICQLASKGIDSEDHAVILHAFRCDVEMVVVHSAGLGN